MQLQLARALILLALLLATQLSAQQGERQDSEEYEQEEDEEVDMDNCVTVRQVRHLFYFGVAG